MSLPINYALFFSWQPPGGRRSRSSCVNCTSHLSIPVRHQDFEMWAGRINWKEEEKNPREHYSTNNLAPSAVGNWSHKLFTHSCRGYEPLESLIPPRSDLFMKVFIILLLPSDHSLGQSKQSTKSRVIFKLQVTTYESHDYHGRLSSTKWRGASPPPSPSVQVLKWQPYGIRLHIKC